MPRDAWKLLASQLVSHHVIFSLHHDRYRVEPSGREQDFVRLDAPDWVNVVPLTDDGQVVFIRQYRHGIRDVTLEVPGGIVDPGESPAAAALRELSEETGYVADAARELGYVWPNPAIQGNRCYTYLAEGARAGGVARPDEFERIEVVTYPLAEVPALLASGQIRHALVVTAFAMLGVSYPR